MLANHGLGLLAPSQPTTPVREEGIAECLVGVREERLTECTVR